MPCGDPVEAVRELKETAPGPILVADGLRMFPDPSEQYNKWHNLDPQFAGQRLDQYTDLICGL